MCSKPADKTMRTGNRSECEYIQYIDDTFCSTGDNILDGERVSSEIIIHTFTNNQCKNAFIHVDLLNKNTNNQITELNTSVDKNLNDIFDSRSLHPCKSEYKVKIPLLVMPFFQCF